MRMHVPSGGQDRKEAADGERDLEAEASCLEVEVGDVGLGEAVGVAVVVDQHSHLEGSCVSAKYE